LNMEMKLRRPYMWQLCWLSSQCLYSYNICHVSISTCFGRFFCHHQVYTAFLMFTFFSRLLVLTLADVYRTGVCIFSFYVLYNESFA
jgi:hypothetical protein